MAKTDVILTNFVMGLGAEADKVTVTAGYARNYLIPNGLAVPATRGNKRYLSVLEQRRGEREARPGREVWQDLVNRSVLVRDFTTMEGVEGCLRVTIGTSDENDRFLNALREALS